MVSVLLAPPVMTNGLSKMRHASSVRNSSATMMAAFMFGSVTFHSRCQAVAPSTLAASCMSSGTCTRPGEQQQRNERRGLPDLGQADHEQRRPAFPEPVESPRFSHWLTKPESIANA